jgi:hypothetical protein
LGRFVRLAGSFVISHQGAPGPLSAIKPGIARSMLGVQTLTRHGERDAAAHHRLVIASEARRSIAVLAPSWIAALRSQ